LFTGNHGPLDSILKAPPLTVTEKRLQIAGAPVFCAMFVDLFDPFERNIPLYGQAAA
jgi:hypothetical protein